MSRWWRAYDDALHDPKTQGLPPRLFKFWFNLLCVASKNDGCIPDLTTLQATLKLRSTYVERHLNELIKRRLVDVTERGLEPHNWRKRQYKSDISTPRVKRFRNVSETPPDTDTDTEKKKVPATSVASEALEVVGEDQRARLFRVGKTILASFGVAEKRTGSLIGQWLKARDDPPGIVAALEYARDHNVAEPVAYVSAIIHGKSNNGGGGHENDRRPGESLGDLGRRLAAKARDLERAKGTRPKNDPF